MGILSGQIALVTGAGRGFGRAIAERLAAEGAQVALLARSVGQLAEVVAVIESAGGTARAFACDVTDPAAIASAVAGVEADLGPVDLLVNNAGIAGPFGPSWQADPEEWWRAQEIHIRAPMLFMNHILPKMVARNSGRVICVSAKAARIVAPHLSAYCTGKIAVNRLVACTAAELAEAESKVSLFAIDPGFVATQLAMDTINSDAAQKHLSGMVGRLKTRAEEDGGQDDLAACAQRCLDLASGRYDALSGGYYEMPDDLDEALVDVLGDAAQK